MLTEAVRSFPQDAATPAHARAFVATWAATLDRAIIAALELVTSELVTNAIRHGEGDVTVRLRSEDEGIEIRVHDHGRTLPVAREFDEQCSGGRGLHLVDSLARDWGTTLATDGLGGKDVWAVVASAG